MTKLDLYLSSVREFHEATESPVLLWPAIPPPERMILRKGLQQEELDEFSDATDDEDLTEIADSLVDQLYILSGTVLEFGLQNAFEELFKEVHRSNMTKVMRSESVATEEAQIYREKGIELRVFESILNDKRVWYMKRKDGKILKPSTYSPANLRPIIDKYIPR